MIYLCEVVALAVGSFGSTIPEHGIEAFMKSQFRLCSRSGTGVAETLKGFLVLDFLCIFGLWELFHCVRSTVSIEK